MQPTLTHIALQVPDLDACIAFYRAFCGLEVIHQRPSGTTWLAEPGKEGEFVFVLLAGGAERAKTGGSDHFGFACASKAEVDDVAARGRAAGCLVWEPHQDDYPVGYYCALEAPDGTVIEFSYGQPLGPGATPIDA